MRKYLGLEGKSYPIEIEEGFSPPRREGESHHYINKSGGRVWYPNAYRRAYGKPIYVHSTVRILVGAGWLIEQGIV